jgi:hypothetical protein
VIVEEWCRGIVEEWCRGIVEDRCYHSMTMRFDERVLLLT